MGPHNSHPSREERTVLEPSIDYSCPHCGAKQTYRLVPGVTPDPGANASPRESPSIDLRCLRCGVNQTYRLVPHGVHTAA
jgi:hypothetical protein